MGAFLLILEIIGALPGVINFLRMLWEYIKKIRNPVEKAAAVKTFRGLIFRRKHLRKMSLKENEDLMSEARGLYTEVQNILNAQEGL